MLSGPARGHELAHDVVAKLVGLYSAKALQAVSDECVV